ncbi:MAG: YcaO-like family protein [Hamadaea sp.]|nr:YcaO-like family protein [Hamadaea sp.]
MTQTTKGFRDGTDRLVPPAQTLATVRPHLAAMGITRIANVTGLDVIGVPVVMACRPNSRGLSVSQGKGLTLDAARASAVMETIESFHAEQITRPLVLGAADELRTTHRLIDAGALGTVAAAHPFRSHAPLLWIEGVDLGTQEPTWVPFDAVHADFTTSTRMARRMFDVTTNGLASGNHYLEAVSHGLCELIERDATARWAQLSPTEQDATRLMLDTVDDPACRRVFDLITTAGARVAVWELTSAAGLPVFRCDLAEDPDRALRPIYTATGYGCHPRREIALLRAVTEAAQSRLSYIAGSRDDMFRREYERVSEVTAVTATWRFVVEGAGVRDFTAAPTFQLGSFAEDVALAREALAAIGAGPVVVVDLSQPRFEIPVVRVIVPGMRFHLRATAAG